jgi:alcohol dehydrogenase
LRLTGISKRGWRSLVRGSTVGMLGGEDLALPYPWIMRNLITVRGQWMYNAAAIPGLGSLVRAGLLDLGHWAVTAFPLTGANDAFAHAAANAGPFKLTVLKP